jgi:membrane-associated phospholipid phosphatase
VRHPGRSAIAVGLAALLACSIAAPASAEENKPSKTAKKKPKQPDGEVDVISGAGHPEDRPPPRRPSIRPSKKDQVRWNPAWRPFEVGDYVATGLFLAGTFASLVIPPVEDRWTTVNDFDASVRDALRLEGYESRERARDASDILLLFSINQLLVDTFIVTWWGHDAGTVAYEMGLINVETIAVTSSINGLVSGFASRQRPYGNDDCEGERNTELVDCRGNKRYRSFFSGHSSMTFAIAGLTCMHHAHLPLYGGGAADALACVLSFGVAAGTATLRVVGDQHFASDVLVGAGFGTLTGTLVPWLLHYRTGQMPEKPKPGEISFSIAPTAGGAVVSGGF